MINKAGREGLDQSLVDKAGNLVGYDPNKKQVKATALDANGDIIGTLPEGRVGVASSAVDESGNIISNIKRIHPTLMCQANGSQDIDLSTYAQGEVASVDQIVSVQFDYTGAVGLSYPLLTTITSSGSSVHVILYNKNDKAARGHVYITYTV